MFLGSKLFLSVGTAVSFLKSKTSRFFGKRINTTCQDMIKQEQIRPYYTAILYINKKFISKGYSTIACIPFLLNITIRCTFPTGLHTVYKTSYEGKKTRFLHILHLEKQEDHTQLFLT